ncbi:unnamed protein product, partial [Discosporangium mesarthrocarpum]
MGEEVAGLLKTARAAELRERILAPRGGRSCDGRTDSGESGAECGRKSRVWMDIMAKKGLVKLRGSEEDITCAEKLLMEFKDSNYVSTIAVGQDDEHMLLGGDGLLRRLKQELQVQLHYVRGRRLVHLRGRRENVEKAHAQLHRTVHGGSE